MLFPNTRTMTETIVIIAYSVLYFTAFSMFGGRYSSEMQSINKMNTLLKTGRFDSEKIISRIKKSVTRIKKIKRMALIAFSILLTVHLIINFLTLDSIDLYNYIVISCLVFVVLLIGVFWLKGNGTVDSNSRMHGGLRI
jgi:Na+/pantothenate symporter